MIRFAKKSDIEEIRRLWDLCFPDEGGFNPYFFAHFFEYTKILLLIENEQICAMVQMLPYRLNCQHEMREITYIYGACTHPDHRRKGYMAQLLEHSFALDRAVGRAASALIPAERWLFDFYKPFGYEPFFYIHRQRVEKTVSVGQMPQRLSAVDIPQIAALYEQLMPTCYIVRDEAYWKKQLAMFDELGQGAYGWWENGRLAAYAFCWENTAQEALGMTPDRAQGLITALGQEAVSYIEDGDVTALGCIKWYADSKASSGYMNLMLN